MSGVIIEKVGDYRVFRVNVSHLTEQQIQDVLMTIKQSLNEAKSRVQLNEKAP